MLILSQTNRDSLVSLLVEEVMKQLYLFHSTCTGNSNPSESAWTWHAGVSGNVLINKKADRLGSYNVWDYADGQDSYQISMLVDLTQPPGKVL